MEKIRSMLCNPPPPAHLILEGSLESTGSPGGMVPLTSGPVATRHHDQPMRAHSAASSLHR